MATTAVKIGNSKLGVAGRVDGSQQGRSIVLLLHNGDLIRILLRLSVKVLGPIVLQKDVRANLDQDWINLVTLAVINKRCQRNHLPALRRVDSHLPITVPTKLCVVGSVERLEWIVRNRMSERHVAGQVLVLDIIFVGMHQPEIVSHLMHESTDVPAPLIIQDNSPRDDW
jgi:hypothetical protein